MKTQSQPSSNDPKNKPGQGETDNDGISKPKQPGNDPDQTPNREVNNPPQGDPVKKDNPGLKPGTKGQN